MNDPELTPDQLALRDHVHLGLRILAGQCDGARAKDDVGFDAGDASLGHRYAAQTELTSFSVMWGKTRCFKYQRQLGEAFIAKLTQLSLDAQPFKVVDLASPVHVPTLGIPPRFREPLSDYNPLLEEDLSDVFALTDEQENAVSTILDWHKSSPKMEFKLGGYAGTGKTTVIRVLRSELGSRIHTTVSAFTGKAVNVLQRKRVFAQTLHSLMYDVHEDAKDHSISFVKKGSLVDSPKLIIIDEASMISNDLYNDLRSFNVKLLFVGDPGQLEPVGDNPNLMAHPDLILSKIHRQAEKSPIIKLATDIRLGTVTRPLYCNLPDLVIRDKQVPASVFNSVDQIICARNATRTKLNTSIRANRGLKDPLVVGEKLICLRNSRNLGVFNGMILFVDSIHASEKSYWLCDLHDEVDTKFRNMKVWKEPFLTPFTKGADIRVPFGHIWCDYGYVITCHKSQGSEWDHVLVVDEYMPSAVWDMKRWRYTAITRAAKKLTLCM